MNESTITSFLQVILNIKIQHTITIIGCIIATIAPGFLFIAHYFPYLMHDLDVIKLTVLSLSITLPSFLIDVLLVLVSVEYKKEDKNNNTESTTEVAFVVSLFVNSIILYFCLAIVWLFSLSSKTYVLFVIIINVFFLVLASYFLHKKKQKNLMAGDNK